MASYLITGSDKKSRLNKALEMSSKSSQGPDLQILEEPSSITEIREIISKLSRKPFQSAKSSIILAECEKLSIEAQNALLKTLEEPPGDSDIYLLIANKELLLPTITSRCQSIDLGQASSALTGEDLKQAWELYRKGRLAELFEQAPGQSPEVWAEIIRQVLFFQMGGTSLHKKSTAAKLREVLEKKQLEEVSEKLDTQLLLSFLETSQKISVYLGSNANRKLAMENLILALPKLN